MADAVPNPTMRQTTASGFAGLFGLFAGLCAIFSGCVTLSDWYTETTQARWPMVSAVIERASIVSRSAPRDGGGQSWRLEARVRYDVWGQTNIATLTSPSVYSEQQAATLRSWAAQHNQGTPVEIRYDPTQPGRAVLAESAGPLAPNRTRTDLILFAFAAIACGALLKLARVLGAREVHAAPAASTGQGGGFALGWTMAATGLLVTGLAVYRVLHANPLTLDHLMPVPAGLMFVFAGILIGLPPQYAGWRNRLAALVATCLALTFDWVAFAPGERQFTGVIGIGNIGVGFLPGEVMGRFVFGIVAAMLDIFAVATWWSCWRQASAAHPSNPTESTV